MSLEALAKTLEPRTQRQVTQVANDVGNHMRCYIT
jgi:hypothetical protein